MLMFCRKASQLKALIFCKRMPEWPASISPDTTRATTRPGNRPRISSEALWNLDDQNAVRKLTRPSHRNKLMAEHLAVRAQVLNGRVSDTVLQEHGGVFVRPPVSNPYRR